MKKQRNGTSNINNDEISDAAPNVENTVSSEFEDQALSPASSTSTRKSSDVLAVILLQILVLIVMVLVTIQYSWLHNVPHILSPLLGDQDITEFTDAIKNYNFIGVESSADLAKTPPSIFAVVIEVAIWSLEGVLARSEYYLSLIVFKKKKFNFWETSSKLISDGAMGIAIAIAVVLFLRATEFLELSLQNANIASIAAISFILGFYHEDTRRLLGSFRRKISESTDESKGNTE